MEAFRPVGRFLFEFSRDDFGLRAPPRRGRYCSFRLIICWIYIGVFILLVIYSIVHQNTLNRDSLSFATKEYYQSKYIHIPQYLLLDTNHYTQLQAKQISRNRVLNIDRTNVTNKNLIQLLFGTKINLAYVTHSNINETLSIKHAKLCSNSSNEWILFTAFDRETLSQAIDNSVYAIEPLSNPSKTVNHCQSLDFNECSVCNLQNDNPRLFQFTKEIRKTSTNSSNEIVYVIYHYIRRKAADYIEHKNRLENITSEPFNLTIMPTLITYQHIAITVELYQSQSSILTTDCLANLRNKNTNRTRTFPMSNPTIIFDSLQPLTIYNICINCQTATKICKQITTLSQQSSFHLESHSYSTSTDIITIISIILTLITFTIIAIKLGLYTFVYIRRQLRKSNEPLPGENNENNIPFLRPSENQEINDNAEEIPGRNLANATNVSSISTIIGQSAQEVFGSTSSIGSRYCNQ